MSEDKFFRKISIAYKDFVKLKKDYLKKNIDKKTILGFISAQDHEFILDPKTNLRICDMVMSPERGRHLIIAFDNDVDGPRLFQIYPPKASPPKIHSFKSLPLPDVYATTTGPASRAFRRATGGTSFWMEDRKNPWLRTKPLLSQDEGTSVIVQANQKSTWESLVLVGDNMNQVRNAQFRYALNTVKQFGADEADWFDLILAKHLEGLQQREKNNPSTWILIGVEDLKRARIKDYNGFRDKEEKEQHGAALRRVLNMELLWEYNADKSDTTRPEPIPYFHSIEITGPPGLEGKWDTSAYQVFPNRWFEEEISMGDVYTAKGLEVSPKMVLQIPPNKTIAKSVARYLVSRFWRQQACDPQCPDQNQYTISLEYLFDAAGIEVPEWAKLRPSQYAKNVQEQLLYLSTSSGAVPLLLNPILVMPTGRRDALTKFLEQKVALSSFSRRLMSESNEQPQKASEDRLFAKT